MKRIFVFTIMMLAIFSVTIKGDVFMPTPAELLAINSTTGQISSFFVDNIGQIWVSTYGAIGDGVTYDTTAFQTAVNAAITNGSYTVFLTSGKTYNLGTLTNYSSIKFIGDNVTIIGDTSLAVYGFSDFEVYQNSGYLSEIINKMQLGETVKIVCYGDSTTWGDNGSGVQTANPYPETLQTRLRLIYNNNNITVVNAGHNGWQSSAGLAAFDSEVTDLNPDLVIVMFGINNISGYVLPITTIETYKSDIIAMVEKCITGDFKALLLTPTFTKMPNLSNSKILAYGECAKEIAKVYSIPYIDMHVEEEKLYKSGSLSAGVGMVDGAHKSDTFYQLMADIILQNALDTNMSKALVVGAEDVFVPAVYTKYIKTDCTFVNSDAVQFNKENYLFVKDGTYGTYLNLEFYVNQAGMDLVLLAPKGTGGGTLTVVDNGVNLPNTINFYAEEQVAYDAPSIVAENLSLGYHKIEFKTSNLVAGDATTDTSNPYMYASLFQFTKNKLIASNELDISKAVDNTNFASLEKFIPVLSGKSSVKYNSNNSYDSIILRSENWAQTKTGKTLVMELEGYLFDKCGFTWFGNKAALNNLDGRTLGYVLVFGTTAVTLYHSGINAQLGVFTDSAATVTLDYALPHKIRIEHIYTGEIKVYIDGTLQITCTSKRHNSGYFGLYNQPVVGQTLTLTRFEYTYK